MQGTARNNAGVLEAKKVFFFSTDQTDHFHGSPRMGYMRLSLFFFASQPAFFIYYNLKYPSLRKQTTFGDATNGFSAKWRLRNERKNSILMTCHYPDLGGASDWLTQTSHALWPFRNTTQIWVVTLHQYGISALVFQTSFRGETVGGVAKCRLFSQAINVLVLLCLVSSHLSWSSSPLSPELSKNVFPVKLLTLSYQFWPERFPYRIFTKCTGFEICKKSQNQNFF